MSKSSMAFAPTSRQNVIVATTMMVLLVLGMITLGHWNTNGSARLFLSSSPSDRVSNKLLSDVTNSTLGVSPTSQCRASSREEDANSAQFEKIFAIILPAKTNQRDSMTLAGAFTGLQIDIVDGVTSVDAKALPTGAIAAELSQGAIKSWRAHINVLQEIVAQNLSSALIMEGDIDWDVRIKSQLQTFAQSSQLLTQPLLSDPGSHLDPSYPATTQINLTAPEFSLSQLNLIQPSSISPYGDNWDVLWLGHCGSRLPDPLHLNTTPTGRVTIYNDSTVAEKQHLLKEWGSQEYLDTYPAHTRVVSHVESTTCSLAYAASQRGARKLLYENGIKRLDGAFDVMLERACDGAEGREKGMTCLTVTPPLFEHHHAVGSKAGESDITIHEGFTKEAWTVNVRWSTRVNFETFLRGGDRSTMEFMDSLPDGQPMRFSIDGDVEDALSDINGGVGSNTAFGVDVGNAG